MWPNKLRFFQVALGVVRRPFPFEAKWGRPTQAPPNTTTCGRRCRRAFGSPGSMKPQHKLE